MSKWTSEPWGIERTENTLWIGPIRADGSGKCAVIVFSIPIGGLRSDVLEERLYTATRIVACVNAMAGIPDPAAFVERARRMGSALQRLAEEHEDQAQAWGGEEGDKDNSEYHAKLAKICRTALETNP